MSKEEKEEKKEKTEETALATTEPPKGGVVAGFGDTHAFELLQRQAKLLASSGLVPVAFQQSVPNTVIALELANRIGASPLTVMQNIHVIHGKWGWSSQFIIGAINSTKKYSPLRFDKVGEGMKRTCTAWAIDQATGDRLEGPTVSMEMAKAEGWLDKAGSKWKTMPELMLMYRSAAFFGRLYAPEVLMGMKTTEEIVDIEAVVVEAEPSDPGETRASKAIKATIVEEEEPPPIEEGEI